MADTVANVVTREMSADEECLVISLAPISSNTAIKAQEEGGASSPRTNQKRRRSQVVQMEMRSYEFVEVNVNGLHEVTSPSASSSSPSFSRISEKLRRLGAGSHAAHQLQCSVFCGGRGCKYENAARWVEAGTAFPELFCHWVTDDILATARPSTLLFREHNLIKKFKDAGISSVINLQLPGEHPHCGPGLDNSSGFTYDPEELMRNDIFFYNYGWPDYGVPSLSSMLDTVKVVDFACSSGKVAVHCHAGLGRTGVLISCYLVYSRRVTAEEAISLVKSRRPGSVQTRGQIELVHQFANHIRLLWRCYPSPTHSFTLKECLDKQALLLHGDKKHSLRNVPRVVHGLCSRMKELSEGNGFTFYCLSLLPPPLPSPSRSPVRTVMKEEDKEGEEECWVVVTCMQEEEMRRRQQHQRQRPCCSTKEEHYLLSLLTCCDCLDSEWARRTLTELELEFNSCWEWPTLAQLTDLSVLIDCLFSFLKRLKEPLLSSDEVHSVMANKSFHLLPSFKKHTFLLVLDTVKLVVPRPLLVQHVHSISNHIATLVTTPTRPRPHESHDSPITVEQITAEYLINEQ